MTNQLMNRMFKSKSSRADKALKQQQLPVFRQDYFKNCHRTYSCIHCRAHLANHDELISKLFQGNHGRAYLFNKVVNIGCKQAVERELLTGLHAVADIFCDSCETTLGWKYEQAFVPSQKYKEGKYIIELVHMLKENNWDLTSYNARELLKEEQFGPDDLNINHFRIGESSIESKSNTERRIRETVRLAESKYNRSDINGTTTNSANNFQDHYSSFEPQQQNYTRDFDLESETSCLRLEDVCHVRPPTQSISINGSNKSQQQPHAQIDMSAGTEMVERSMNQLNSDVQQGSSVHTTSRQKNYHIVGTSKTLLGNQCVNSPQDSLCSSRSPSDLSSTANITDSSCTNENSKH